MSLGTQLAVRLDDDTVAQIDELVRSGRFASKTEALRVAMASYLENERRRQVGEAIAEGYRRIPQSEEELLVAEQSARAMIAEEPW
jgi:Arc/MetJ-type ribon-helix-helix transcriptional regulator